MMPKTSPATRAELAAAARLVVKVGSSSLTDRDGFLDPTRLNSLVDALAARLASGRQVVLVSSGAQAAGMGPLGLTRKPRDLAEAQAAASVGQGLLMAHYTRAFGRHGLKVGQILLTAEDLIRRHHYLNAERALTTLLARGVVPIVNENDAVATEEIRFGDNDRLAALVAHVVQADGLILLTDVDALYTAPPSRPGSRPIVEVDAADDLEALEIGARGSEVGTGGMITKVQAATLATSSGIPVLLTRADLVRQALGLGADVGSPASSSADNLSADAAHLVDSADAADCSDGELGTFFHVTGRRVSAKQLWLAYAASPQGRILIDQGAARAVTERKKSLLLVGVTGAEGEFSPGQVVEVVDPDGKMVARGLAGYSAEDINRLKGLSLAEIGARLGPDHAHEAIHRDDLVPHARGRRPTA